MARRPDMKKKKNIEAGVMADGIGCAVAGRRHARHERKSELVGIEKTTGATSRHRVGNRGMAGFARLLPKVFEPDRQHAASGHGCGVVFPTVL